MSIVRQNLLTQKDYTPYCGNNHCSVLMPRSRFNGHQFECVCGWKSSFEPEFIEQYKKKQAELKEAQA